MKKLACGSAFIVSALLAFPALADTNDTDWEVRLTPYVWTAGVEGSVTHPALSTPISAEASFGDVLDRLDIGGMAALEARKGRVGIIADALHIRMSDTAAMPLLGLPVDLSTRTTNALLAGAVRVVEADAGAIDALVGARYWSVSTRIGYTIPDAFPLPPDVPLPRVYDGRKGAKWVDAMTGLKLRANLSQAVHATATGMFGFGGSDMVTDFALLVGIDISRRMNLTLGYRHIDVDYSSNGFVFNAKIHGPLIGAGIRF